MSAYVDQNMDILSKNPGSGGAGIYSPAAYESKAVGGKRRSRRQKTQKRTKRIRRRTRSTKKNGILGKARKMIKKVFHI